MRRLIPARIAKHQTVVPLVTLHAHIATTSECSLPVPLRLRTLLCKLRRTLTTARVYERTCCRQQPNMSQLFRAAVYHTT